ncbi:MAG: archease [Alphaproteobacteria bacterium]|nr:archease [Alphaproteobacteria bacterium]
MADGEQSPSGRTSASGAWCHFHHGADIGVRGTGPTREAAFEQAALALSAIVTDLDRIAERSAVEVACEAPNDALLLVDWLNALIYRMAVDHMLFRRFEVRIEGRRLVGRAWGEAVDRERHEPAVEPKGATFTALAVDRGPDGSWRAQCIVDV